jgi:hypothetical protein
MSSDDLANLENRCKTVPAILHSIPETEFTYKPSQEKWSKKEILGHLIDSATINHHRFVRAQFENTPIITYDQNMWNQNSYYQQIKTVQLIQFWTVYNFQLLELIKLIPPAKLLKECNTGGQNNETIEWLIRDYIFHLEHHLKQIIEISYNK